MRRLVYALALLGGAAAYDYTSVPGETCDLPVAEGTEPKCSANAEIFLVLDNSQSFYNIHGDVNQWAEAFVDSFILGASSDSRIGLINFNGCLTCSDEQSATVAHNLTSDLTSLRAAIAAREGSSRGSCPGANRLTRAPASRSLRAFNTASRPPPITTADRPSRRSATTIVGCRV